MSVYSLVTSFSSNFHHRTLRVLSRKKDGNFFLEQVTIPEIFSRDLISHISLFLWECHANITKKSANVKEKNFLMYIGINISWNLARNFHSLKEKFSPGQKCGKQKGKTDQNFRWCSRDGRQLKLFYRCKFWSVSTYLFSTFPRHEFPLTVVETVSNVISKRSRRMGLFVATAVIMEFHSNSYIRKLFIARSLSNSIQVLIYSYLRTYLLTETAGWIICIGNCLNNYIADAFIYHRRIISPGNCSELLG